MLPQRGQWGCPAPGSRTKGKGGKPAQGCEQLQQLFQHRRPAGKHGVAENGDAPGWAGGMGGGGGRRTTQTHTARPSQLCSEKSFVQRPARTTSQTTVAGWRDPMCTLTASCRPTPRAGPGLAAPGWTRCTSSLPRRSTHLRPHARRTAQHPHTVCRMEGFVRAQRRGQPRACLAPTPPWQATVDFV
jgi:hypothetical protein